MKLDLKVKWFHIKANQFTSVQSLSLVRLFATPWIAAHQASLSITNSRRSLRLTSIESFSSCPQSLPSSGSFPMSQLFAWGSQSTGISALVSSPSKEHPGLISFRMDWLDLLTVQGTLKSLLQHHSSKASILQCSAFFQRRQWHPTPVLLPGESHGWRSLVGCSPWGRYESDTTEQLHFHLSL